MSSNSLEIVQNPFGNYLIQHILDEWGQESAEEAIDMIISNIVSLSMQKFSSNVVEKCFDVIDMVCICNIILIIFVRKLFLKNIIFIYFLRVLII